MNAEELKTEFGLEFPTEIDGYKRPGALENGHDWFLEIPQIIAKDKVLYTGMNLILSALLSNEKLLKQWHDTLQNVVNEQDWRVVTDSLKGYMTPELKKKLDGIATGANNYIHPSSHPATMITQDATHRFVTDTEKNTWNGKASTAVVSTSANGLAPKRDGNASHFLAGDGTWKAVPSASSAASATKATQDSRGQQIDTTYVKGVTGSNATLTVTKGNGSTSSVTVNNVANATNANNLVISGTSAHIKYGGGDVDENSAISQNKVNLLIGSWYSTGFRDLCSSGTPIKVAINHRNGNIKTLGSVTASGGFKGNADTASKLGTASVGSGVKPIYLNAGSPVASGSTVGNANRPIYMNGGTLSQCSIDLSTLAPKASPALTGSPTAPTQGTSDNSTKIATTAFVRNLINQFKTDGTLGGIVGGSLTQNGWVKFSNGLILQWGTYPGSGGTIRYPVSFTSKVFAVISSSSLNFNATDINNLAYWTTTDTNIGNNWKTSGWYLAMGK
ncbi:gp53-like domain-containing protein [Megamonas funiformis]|uniref:gp53-like domain-containing protein n=1 Tax=Megamonas funiformis TaxID=437897 RepID=UPI0026662AAA|nr:hypothetical protein [Megamonas funiformis]